MSDDHDIARRVQEMLSASGGRVASEASSNVSEGLGSPPRAGSALRPSLESEPLSVPHARELSQVADVLLRNGYELTALELEREISERYGPAHGVQNLLSFLQSDVFEGRGAASAAARAEEEALGSHPALSHVDISEGAFLKQWAPLAERDARIAVLEFELRSARESLRELRDLAAARRRPRRPRPRRAARPRG